LPPQLIGYMQPHVTQHELFIRAAMEGRRDHIYQAAMFDPLTAATMPTDKIVEMCDELIEGHRDFLPPLDAKKTLIPTSGKSFSPPTPQELRASWDAAQEKAVEDMIDSWASHRAVPQRAGRGSSGAGHEIVAEDLAAKGLGQRAGRSRCEYSERQHERPLRATARRQWRIEQRAGRQHLAVVHDAG
jgi:hypothetical protein